MGVWALPPRVRVRACPAFLRTPEDCFLVRVGAVGEGGTGEEGTLGC